MVLPSQTYSICQLTFLMGPVGVHQIPGRGRHGDNTLLHGTLHPQRLQRRSSCLVPGWQGGISHSEVIQERPLSARQRAQCSDDTSFIPRKNDHFTDGQTEALKKEAAELSLNPGSLSAGGVKCPPGSPGFLPTHLRLKVLVYEDIVAVQLEAMLVTDDHLLHTLQAPDEDVVHVTEECLHCLGPVLGCQVLSEALEHPLAALGPKHPGWEREPQLTGNQLRGPSNSHHQHGSQA